MARLLRHWWRSAEPAAGERSHLGDPVEIAVDMHDTELVVHCGLGDEQVGDWGAVSHVMVVREVALQPQRTVKDVGRCGDNLEAGMQLDLQLLVMAGRSSRVELFKLADGAHEQRPGKLCELPPDSWFTNSSGCALVEPG
jgi:hypothetical protein